MNENYTIDSDISKFDMTPPDFVIMFNDNSKELLKFCHNGEIYYKGRLITTDEEIVKALRALLECRCYNCIEKEKSNGS